MVQGTPEFVVGGGHSVCDHQPSRLLRCQASIRSVRRWGSRWDTRCSIPFPRHRVAPSFRSHLPPRGVSYCLSFSKFLGRDTINQEKRNEKDQLPLCDQSKGESRVERTQPQEKIPRAPEETP